MEKLLTKKEVIAMIGLTAYRLDLLIRSNNFPTAIRLMDNSRPLWRLRDIEAWNV